jgi:hypothetical protein
MKTVLIKKVAEACVRLRGYDLATGNLTASDMATLAERINDRVKEGWEAAFWPEAMRVEQREYRETWEADANYAAGSEVWRRDGDGELQYFESELDGNVGHDPLLDDGTWWKVVDESFVRSIRYQEDGETEIGAVDQEACVFGKDPRVYPGQRPVTPVETLGDKLMVQSVYAPLQPWLKFRPPAPEFSLTEWDAARNYAIGDTAYLAARGESYRAIRANVNKDPYAETDDWEPVGFPEFLMTFVKYGVRADEIEEDEAKGKMQYRAQQEMERLVDVLLVGRQQDQRAGFLARRR